MERRTLNDVDAGGGGGNETFFAFSLSSLEVIIEELESALRGEDWERARNAIEELRAHALNACSAGLAQ